MTRLSANLPALLVCLVLVSCGAPVGREAEPPAGSANPTREEAEPPAGGVNPTREEAEAPGAPTGGGGDAEAYGAPIEIPAKADDSGKTLDYMMKVIKDGIRRQCPRHNLCVKVRVEARDRGSLSACRFDQTEPKQGSKVRQGSTVVIITGREPCSTPSTSDTGDSSPPAVQSPAPSSPDVPEPTVSP
ncbi:hypothetical protein ACIBHY_40620 [Nonomuraea sp. NPDC050547]|uniref:hypothetical protein n=1 Tax=Nonomuraea sp. NPDC050547 TaxID=3364368 RepID=UPI0037AA1F80